MPQPPGDGPAEVTVVCITYQHEDYIAAALDSFLSQQTSFRFQVYVGEACGTDRTADIIRDYAERYPDVIVPFIRESNLGAQRNLIDMCQRAGTKYIAFCEGDDYWIDEHKLQKQHDYMESHPEFSGCFHNTRIETAKNWYLDSFYQPNPDGERLIPFSIPRYDRSLRAMRMGYYLRFGPAHTSSFFLRWNYDLEIPSWYYETVFGDHPLMALQIGNGLLGFLPDVMSVYRRHAGGIIMSSSERRHHLATRRDWLIVLEGLEEHFRTHYGSFAATDIRARMVTEMRNYLVNAVRSGTEVTVTDIIANHPRAFALMMDDYARTSRLRYSLINRLYGGDIAGVRPGALSEVTSLLPRLALSTRRNQRKRRRAVDYEQFSKATKVRGRWLFLCDDQISYRGNVRSFYENVVAAHPEIEAHWLTKSTWVLKLLQSEGLPVTRLKTAESRQLLASAELLVCQSLRSDVFEMRGFNPGLRIVRLLDNAYHNMERQLAPLSGLEAYAEDELESWSKDSPRRWIHANNLIVTDSGLQQRRLLERAAEGSATVLRITAEPRLVSIQEPLVPPGHSHVLFLPQLVASPEGEETVVWLTEHAVEINNLCRERGVVLQLYGGWMGRLQGLVRELVAGLDSIEVLQTNDIYSRLSQFSGAVTGVSDVAFSLRRLGVPVVLGPDATAASASVTAAVLPGPICEDLMTALRQVTDEPQLAEPGLAQITDHFGLAENWEDPLSELFIGIKSWLEEGHT